MISEKNKRYIKITEARLNELMTNPDIPSELAESMAYSVDAGGKRLRSCMLLAACETFGGSLEEAADFAAAIEMIHTYSLIHDDLPCMDNDDYRRGKLSNHKMFGEGRAVLAGDGLLNYAFETLLNSCLKDEKRCFIKARAAKELAYGAGVTGMIAGQTLDLSYENRPSDCDSTEQTLIDIDRGKTGAIIRAALLAGGILANADEFGLHRLSDFGKHYGVLFQITDDILDVTGNMEDVGKTIGKDEQSNKLTYVSLCGLDGAKEKALAAANSALCIAEQLGERGAYFKELVETTLNRKK